MLAALKRAIPWPVKRRIGRWLALRRALADDRVLGRRQCALKQRHLDSCRLLADRAALLAALPHGGTVAEVGVAKGDFSQQILDIAQPRRLHLIDTWASSVPGSTDKDFRDIQARFGSAALAERVAIHRAVSWDALRTLPEASLDWAYIDAGHRYEDVARDLAAATHAVKPDGFIAGHDYVRWSSATGRFGVIEAVNELCLDRGYALRYLTLEPGMHLSWAVQRMAATDR